MDWLDMNKLNRFGNKHRDRYTCVSSLMSISMHLRESMNSYFCRSFARHFRDPQTWTSLALRLKIGDKTGTLAYPVWCLSMHLRESLNNYFCGFLARHFRDPQTWTSLALWLRIGPNLWLLGTEFTLQRLLRLQLFELATPSPILGIGAVCYTVKEETDTEAHRGNAEDA